mgnify:CR=1 FL=1
MQKKGRKDTTIFIKKPYSYAVLAPFLEPLSPRRKVNMLINRYLIKQGDSDRRFVTFYFFHFKLRLSDCTLPFRTNTTSENQLNNLNFILIRVSAQSVDSGD